jgi:sugar phosphate isomerase/epimerase
MIKYRYTEKITCAYLYTISKYGYPPDIRKTKLHIEEMARLGFTSIELEGIGKKNIEYLFANRREIADILAEQACSLPVLCIVLPQLSAADRSRHSEALELFEVGCETAQYFGAQAVLDNGPLLNLGNPAPVKRHYSQEQLLRTGFPEDFEWDEYWENLIKTYRQACRIAARYQLAYHMHPCEGSLITHTDSFINFAGAVDSPNLRFNLDTANQYYFKDNLALSVIRLADRINYIHISDNSGSRVEHLVPGDGKINWDSFFGALQKINYKGHLAIDVGGDETGIQNIEEAYLRSASWLEEQVHNYLFANYRDGSAV